MAWYVVFDYLKTTSTYYGKLKIIIIILSSYECYQSHLNIIDIYLKQVHVSKCLRWKPIDYITKRKWTYDYMDTFFKQIGPCSIASHDAIDLRLIEKHLKRVGSDAWSNLSLCQDLPKDFVIKHGG